MNNIDTIINNKLSGIKLSDSQEQTLKKWLLLEDNNLIFKDLEKVWQLSGNLNFKMQVNLEAEWNSFKDRHKKQKSKKLYFTISTLAASIVLLIGLLFFFPQKPTVYKYSEGHKHFVLPDSSDVWLNKKSNIKFLKTFGKKDRNIFLEGEAFFKVRKGNIPFIVNTSDDIAAKVLGTSFNLKKEANNKVYLQVLSGLVEFGNFSTQQLLKVKKGNEAVYFKNTDKLTSNILKNENKVSWATGNFYFNENNLSEVITLLENYLSVKIDIPQSFEEKKFSGTFNQPTIQEVQHILSKAFDLNNTYKNKKLTFTEKK